MTNYRYYLDIDATNFDALGFLYSQLHLLLASNENDVAVAFPHYHLSQGARPSLGLRLRLLAKDESTFTDLLLIKSRAALLSHELTFGEVARVPDEVIGYARFTRSNRKSFSALQRQAHFLVKKGFMTDYDTAFAHVREENKRRPNPHPSVNMLSFSTGNQFLLHIKMQLVNTPVVGPMGSYGLSQGDKGGSVPLF